MQHKCSVEGPRSEEKEETLLFQAGQSFVGEAQPISASLEGKGLVVTFFFSFFLVVAILFKAKKQPKPESRGEAVLVTVRFPHLQPGRWISARKA